MEDRFTKSRMILFDQRFILLTSIAFICSFLGIGLKIIHSTDMTVLPWLVLLLFLPLMHCYIPKIKSIRHCGNFWIWIISALFINITVYLVGYFNNVHLRSIGPESFQIRVNLWSLLLVIAFLSSLVHKEKLSNKQVIYASGMLFIYSLTLLLQPDLYSMTLLYFVVLGFAFTAKDLLRKVLFSLTAVGFLSLVFTLLNSVYRFERFVYGWLFPNKASLEQGQVLTHTQQVFNESGWWGSTKETANNILLTNPDFELYALPLLSYWKGNLVTVVVVVMLGIFTWLLYSMLNKKSNSKKTFLSAALAIWSFNLIFAIGSPIGLLPYVDHYGIAFLSLSDMTILGCILIFTINNRKRCI